MGSLHVCGRWLVRGWGGDWGVRIKQCGVVFWMAEGGKERGGGTMGAKFEAPARKSENPFFAAFYGEEMKIGREGKRKEGGRRRKRERRRVFSSAIFVNFLPLPIPPKTLLCSSPPKIETLVLSDEENREVFLCFFRRYSQRRERAHIRGVPQRFSRKNV